MPAPGVAGEIVAVSTKKRDAFGDGDATDAPIDDRRMHALCGWKKTALEDAPELHVICAGGLEQLVRLLKRNGDRLLDDRVTRRFIAAIAGAKCSLWSVAIVTASTGTASSKDSTS